MTLLWIVAGVALAASLLADRRKTRFALVHGLKMIWAVVPLLVGILALKLLHGFFVIHPDRRRLLCAWCSASEPSCSTTSSS